MTMGLSRTVSEIKRRFQLKVAFFPARVFIAPAEWVRLQLSVVVWGSKTRMMGLPGRERDLAISSSIWIQYTNVTVIDRRTDTVTPDDSKVRDYA